MKKLIWVLLAIVFAYGCSAIIHPDPDKDLKESCVPGESKPCTCKNGTNSTRTCQDSGTLGNCYCPEDGSAGSAATGDSGGAGSGGSEDAGGAGGEPSGGSGGSGGEPSGGSGGAGGSGGSDGGQSPIYGPCTTNEDCASPLTCYEATGIFSIAIGHLCSDSCQNDQDCPDPTTGDATAGCSTGTTNICWLNCGMNRACPDGMSCVTIISGRSYNTCVWP